MANLRELKKEIDYRLEEVVFDCDMAIAFQPSKEQEIFELMQKAVALRNELIAKSTRRRSRGVPFFGKFCGRRQATVSSRSYPCRSLRGAPGRAACNRGGVFSCIAGFGIESVENR